MTSIKCRDGRETQLSACMEDYLEAILVLERETRVARVKDISRSIGVSRASVTEALKSLSKRGLVKHDRYGFVMLTSDGEKLATEVDRKHGVISTFLREVLGVDKATADRNACQFEHSIDRAVLDRLLLFMERFRECPRGGAGWIDGCATATAPEREYEACKECLGECLTKVEKRFKQRECETPVKPVRLSELTPGSRGRIVKVGGGCEYRKRLAEMGLCRGTIVEVERVAPLGDPILVNVRGYSLSLRKDEAMAVLLVRSVKEDRRDARSGRSE
jgi:DtxR family transcriptional regulator, Mn-dependent transcriptional regulator